MAVESPTEPQPDCPGPVSARSWHGCPLASLLSTWARGPASAGPEALGTDPPGEGVHPVFIIRLSPTGAGPLPLPSHPTPDTAPGAGDEHSRHTVAPRSCTAALGSCGMEEGCECQRSRRSWGLGWRGRVSVGHSSDPRASGQNPTEAPGGDYSPSAISLPFPITCRTRWAAANNPHGGPGWDIGEEGESKWCQGLVTNIPVRSHHHCPGTPPKEHTKA